MIPNKPNCRRIIVTYLVDGPESFGDLLGWHPRLLPNHATYLDNPAGAQYLNTSEKIFCHLRRIASVRYQTKPLAKAIFRGLRNCKLSNYLNICMYCTQLEFATISSSSKPVGPPVAWITTRLSTWRMCIRAMRSYIEIFNIQLPSQSSTHRGLLKYFSFLSSDSLRIEVLITAVRHSQHQQQYDED